LGKDRQFRNVMHDNISCRGELRSYALYLPLRTPSYALLVTQITNDRLRGYALYR